MSLSLSDIANNMIAGLSVFLIISALSFLWCVLHKRAKNILRKDGTPLSAGGAFRENFDKWLLSLTPAQRDEWNKKHQKRTEAILAQAKQVEIPKTLGIPTIKYNLGKDSEEDENKYTTPKKS